MGGDTIAAIATAMTNAGIGIIRISGKDALSIASAIFRPADKKLHLSDVKSHTIHYGFLFDGNALVDEVMVSVMKEPRSYTAEDTVEINCHGNSFFHESCFGAGNQAGSKAGGARGIYKKGIFKWKN